MDRLGTPAKLAPKPAWGWLYGATALGFTPFALVAALVPEGAIRTALEIVAAVALTAVLALWIRVNRIRIELQGRRDGGWRQATITVATPSPPADLFRPEHSNLRQRRERATSPGSPLDRTDLGHAPFVTATRG